MSSRARGNTRRKNRLAHDSDEDDAPVAIKPSSKQSGIGARVAPTAASKLSFGDDVQETVTIKKKKRKPKALSIPGADAEAPEERAGAYSSEALQQLKLSTPQMPAAFAANGGASTRLEPAGVMSVASSTK